MMISGKIKDFMFIEEEQYSENVIRISERGKYLIMILYGVFIFASSFFFNSVGEIMDGMKKILLSPSVLISDYIEIGNMGAAFFNSGLITLAAILILVINRVHMSGPIIASIFLITGFGFFGKNVYNIWSILMGAYLFSLTRVESFSRYIVLAFFGTAMAPVVSQISFGLGYSPLLGIVFGNLAGIIIGFIMIPLANHFVSFHQGFNLYNMGFTAGIIATLFMSFFRAFGHEPQAVMILSEGNNLAMSLYFGALFIVMIIIGFLLNNRSLKGYKALLRTSGRLVSDFVTVNGFGISFVNMGLIGLISIGYVLLVGGELSGIVIGGVMTVAGFGAYGKHPKNIIPIILGVYIASLFKIWDTNSVAYLVAALFGTSLAPIAGMFGWKAGILAGIVHSSVVMNIGYLHGGMNLYNNGFSSGIVAAVLVPLIINFKRRD